MSEQDLNFKPLKFNLPKKEVKFFGYTLEIMRLPEHNVGAILIQHNEIENYIIAFVDNWDNNMEFRFLEDEAVQNVFKNKLNIDPRLINDPLYQALKGADIVDISEQIKNAKYSSDHFKSTSNK